MPEMAQNGWKSGQGLENNRVNGLFDKNFEFGPLFGYDNFQNEIDTWETTVRSVIACK